MPATVIRLPHIAPKNLDGAYRAAQLVAAHAQADAGRALRKWLRQEITLEELRLAGQALETAERAVEALRVELEERQMLARRSPPEDSSC